MEPGRGRGACGRLLARPGAAGAVWSRSTRHAWTRGTAAGSAACDGDPLVGALSAQPVADVAGAAGVAGPAGAGDGGAVGAVAAGHLHRHAGRRCGGCCLLPVSLLGRRFLGWRLLDWGWLASELLLEPPSTGASTVDEADRTNSPMSFSMLRTVLLSTPSSFASS